MIEEDTFRKLKQVPVREMIKQLEEDKAIFENMLWRHYIKYLEFYGWKPGELAKAQAEYELRG
jgi:hypothetical protein